MVIDEDELGGIWPSHFYEIQLVNKAQFSNGTTVWGDARALRFGGTCLLVIVEDPKNPETIVRIKRQLFEQHLATPLAERRD